MMVLEKDVRQRWLLEKHELDEQRQMQKRFYRGGTTETGLQSQTDMTTLGDIERRTD